MERIQALTVLKGTRAAARRAKELTIAQTTAKGQLTVINALAPYTRPPPCSLVLRPAGSALMRLSSALTHEMLSAAIRDDMRGV